MVSLNTIIFREMLLIDADVAGYMTRERFRLFRLIGWFHLLSVISKLRGLRETEAGM